MGFPPFPGCPQFISSSNCFQIFFKKKITPGVGEMDQQLKTHAVLVEDLGLIPSAHVADKNICNSNSRDLTPSVASVDTAHAQYTCTHARKTLLCRKYVDLRRQSRMLYL